MTIINHSILFAALLSGTVSAHEGEHSQPKEVLASARTGNGQFTFVADAKWGTLPDKSNIGPTHGSVVVDSKRRVYVSTDGPGAILVFAEDGTFINKISGLQKLHHMTLVSEGEKEFIYGAHLGGKRVVKLDLEGNLILQIPNDNTGEVAGGFNGVTGIAVASDGAIYCSTGYGANMIHKFDKEGKKLLSFGGKSKTDKEKFVTPHSLSIDQRYEEPRLLVCDREKRRLVHFSMEGAFIGEHAVNLRRPCAVSFHGDHVAVAELESRVVILDKKGTIVSIVGDNPNRKHWANFKVAPEEQKIGVFSAPHGLSFDSMGNLYVQDWNKTGRVTKLTLQK